MPKRKQGAYEYPHERMAKARRRARFIQWVVISLIVVGLVAISVTVAVLPGT